MKFRDIKQFPFASYRCNVPFTHVPNWIEDHIKANSLYNFEMNPEYQRGYVWTEKQKTAWLEYRLKGGFSGRDIFWNCPHWLFWKKRKDNTLYTMELVDGKQRIDSVLGFLNNEIKVFGLYRNEFEDDISVTTDLVFHVNNLVDRRDVVNWYLGMNTGGSIHTEKDLQPAYDLLKELDKPENKS